MKNTNQVFWTMKDGTQIDVDTMDITHLRNTLKMIIRNIEAKKEKKLTHLHGEIAQQMYDQMIEEEFSGDSDYEIFIGEL